MEGDVKRGREVKLRVASYLLGSPRAGPLGYPVQVGNFGGGNSTNQGMGK